jgi:hypothetical protein
VGAFRAANRIAPPMGPVSATIAIDAPRERVFDLIIDLAIRPALCDHFIEDYRLERLPPSGEGAAARFRVTAGNYAYMETVIAEAERPFRIRERGRTGRWDRIPVHTVWEIVEGPGAVSTVTVTFWTEASHSLDRLRDLLGANRSFRRAWERALERLRELAESDADPDRRVEVAGADRLAAGLT